MPARSRLIAPSSPPRSLRRKALLDRSAVRTMRPLLVRGGAVWQLVGLITRRSQVQILPPLPLLTLTHSLLPVSPALDRPPWCECKSSRTTSPLLHRVPMRRDFRLREVLTIPQPPSALRLWIAAHIVTSLADRSASILSRPSRRTGFRRVRAPCDLEQMSANGGTRSVVYG